MNSISLCMAPCPRRLATKVLPISCGYAPRIVMRVSKYLFMAKQADRSRRGSISKHQRPSPARTDLIRPEPCSFSSPKWRLPPGHSTMTLWQSRTRMYFSPTNRRLRTLNRHMPTFDGSCLRPRSSSSQRIASPLPTPSKAICSMPNW